MAGAALFVDGSSVGGGRIDGTVPMVFPADETCDLSEDTGSPVADDYPANPRFTGRIHWVELDIRGDDHHHFTTPRSVSASP